MAITELQDLEKLYPHGVKLLKEQQFYERTLSEVNLLVKYFDNNYFYKLLSENIFDDIRGVFNSFINKDLKRVYEEIRANPVQALEVYLERDFDNLAILKSCSMNVRYQVSGLMRLPQTRTILFKSTFLQFVYRKFNGEIQIVYKELSQNYKKFFRRQFAFSNNSGTQISIDCIEKLSAEYRSHFLDVANRFYYLGEGLNFVHDLFLMELRKYVQQRVGGIFYENQEKMSRLLNYFIDDLKHNFIRELDRQCRSGRDFFWIRKGFLKFLDSARFEKLLRRVILQSLTVMHHIAV